MMRPAPLSASELLDEPVHDPEELAESLGHLEAVNRWLGGRRALLRRLDPLLRGATELSILDVGTGSGDLPRALVERARQLGGRLRVLATDRHPQMLERARAASIAYPEISFEPADALALPFPDRAFDVALLSLTLHHLDGAGRMRALRELRRVARRAVVVSELERCWPNYLGARLLALTVWRRNRLTRHDGPVSVRRAFTRGELHQLAREAGIENAMVERCFFHRLILSAQWHSRQT